MTINSDESRRNINKSLRELIIYTSNICAPSIFIYLANVSVTLGYLIMMGTGGKVGCWKSYYIMLVESNV